MTPPFVGARRLIRAGVCGWLLSVATGASAEEVEPLGNPFGMQLRRPPARAEAIFAPVILRPALTNESSLLTRRDGTLEIYSITKPASDSVSVVRSRDGGLTWSEPEVAFPLPGKAYYAVRVLEGREGMLHAVLHVGGEGPGGYRGKLYEVYYASRAAGASAWTAPRRIVPGYIGSIRGFIELTHRDRLLLSVARAIPGRMVAPKHGPDLGWNDVFVYYSDDRGGTWQQTADPLSIELRSPAPTRYGAIEPALLELRDGRVWMLVRDRQGRLFQSFSTDGARWPPLERSPFISSDSPATLLRLRDGRIVLLTNACQNWSDPRSYAIGGREVLHAAISADDGRTWRGFREVFHETNIAATRGDRGTAYASAAENRAGKVVVVSGQGEGKRAIFAFDPRWLEATEERDDLSLGPVGWTAYGAATPRVAPDSTAVMLRIEGSAGGALWNFPIGNAGELSGRLDVPDGVDTLQLCLTDQFNRIDDRKAAQHAVFVATIAQRGSVGFRLTWRDATSAQGGQLGCVINGGPEQKIVALRPAQFGVNYLRIEFQARSGTGEVAVSGVHVRVW